MNSALLSTLDTEQATEVEQASKSSSSTLAEIATIITMYLATSAVVLLLSLTWVM
ncbi:hypothetical protein [Vibrio hangzhouensis]|uniref:hypothetical protein n=1 Tax=Vibrio hangzhouensis TaxID=462991 RepID=UPI001C94EA44|nr:hypothetical protein [Vibrio hangzhouensis]MBY6196103.1 hypothetical protein [Vibrio hangzhouensis]